ncbi:hypothetical protein EOM82_07955 [bacterium]|nr:hypothetical protein [bacterium]
MVALHIFLMVSKNNSISESTCRVFVNMPYIVFECKNKQQEVIQKAINVFYYSKKQTAKIIDETILRAKMSGNELLVPSGQEMIAELCSTGRRA